MYTLTTAVIVTLAVTTKNALRPYVKKKKKLSETEKSLGRSWTERKAV